MTTATALFSSHSHPLPRIRRLGLPDLRAALAAGIDDFRAMPTHVLFVILIYPVAGLVIGAATFNSGLIPLLFPLASGFALVGPFAALGLYEMSRRREQGLDPSWMRAYGALHTPSAGAIFLIGLLLAAIFLAWLVTAMGLYWALYGGQAQDSIPAFAREVLTTGRGWTMILIGNLAGFAFSLLALAVSVVSLPMLADRTVDARMAVRTSIAVVQENPLTMLMWGVIVASLLVVGMLPLFVGLAIVMPILGHATWHLYRRAVP
ncbi:DUF2189 domain-containing protein [Methylobacterium haplocladii]|uniref:Cytochrome c oxidase subunit I n=1 Tax=Methylobacterium haplocladii TaxID=1176176 RepID=A0A512IU96_9HYPH|nr:DUF2189 domain-containing protein [Methylobacterium haplocladii]GEP01277.1 hypothetical protein MHA02_36640 [Methylobacterium haplocladii]GJD86128.1 hypothetical protein HPGCJGGD_4025 [Methylobacterium haplocladii]GLS60764.1 hypothetical protein GCM10007887_34510 [Methylobacterium haplocladii]